MTATRRRLAQVQAILQRVVARPPAERAQALAEACGGDEALADEVVSLLPHAEALGGFLEQPVLEGGLAQRTAEAAEAAGAGEDQPDPLLGTLVGRFRLERRLGSGGMGTVYEASRADGSFAQRVALKIVKRGMDSDEILTRFQRERQLLAALEHPHIARLLDGGATGSGQPWLALEYVEGQPIDAWCDARSLDVTARLRLFLAVCDSVRSAHQKLVVHRDLKPGNILVTAEGVPKLLDFGIAAVLDGARPRAATRAGERRLTPEYASPEQLAGAPPATSSDVYSLGVILYELLCGRRPHPFETDTPTDVARVLAEHVPEPPSAVASAPAAAARGSTRERLARRLRGDLDTIALSALHHDPARRYASVEQLALDVRRHLEGLPVHARRDTFSYRASRFVRRHALACALAAAAALAMIAGALAFAWQARVAGRERDEAFVAREQAEAITGFLQDMLISADPANRGREVLVRDVLAHAAARLDTELADQGAVRAALRAAIGRTWLSLGLYDEAEAAMRRAHAERVALRGPRHHDVAESLADLAELLYARGELDEAALDLQLALEIFREVRPGDSTDAAATLSSLGAVRRAQGRLDEAEQLHRESLLMRRALAGGDDLEVAESLNNLAGVALARGDLAAARELLASALEIRRRDLGAGHPLVVQSLDNLAFVLLQAGDLQAAEPMFREALDTGVEVLGDEHPEVAVTRKNLARLLLQRGEAAEAEALLARSLAVRERLLEPADPRLVGTRLELAQALATLGRMAEAEAQLDLLQSAEASLPAGSPEREALRERIHALRESLR